MNTPTRVSSGGRIQLGSMASMRAYGQAGGRSHAIGLGVASERNEYSVDVTIRASPADSYELLFVLSLNGQPPVAASSPTTHRPTTTTAKPRKVNRVIPQSVGVGVGTAGTAARDGRDGTHSADAGKGNSSSVIADDYWPGATAAAVDKRSAASHSVSLNVLLPWLGAILFAPLYSNWW